MQWREVLALEAVLDRTTPDAPTTVRIGGHEAICLPTDEGAARDTAVDRIACILRTVRQNAGAGLDANGRIRVRRACVPVISHGDVVAVLDAFCRSGVDDVEFGGAPVPIPHHPPVR